MKFLVCLNKSVNPYTSALSEKMMRTLSEQYDVIVNECMIIDIQEEENHYWCHLAIAAENLSAQIRTILDYHKLQHKDIAPNSYSWQQNRTALEVQSNANALVAILKKPDAEIIFYEGPNGHPR